MVVLCVSEPTAAWLPYTSYLYKFWRRQWAAANSRLVNIFEMVRLHSTDFWEPIAISDNLSKLKCPYFHLSQQIQISHNRRECMSMVGIGV